MTTEREKQLEDVLAKFLKPVKGIPFEVIVKSLVGHNVEKFQPETDQVVLEQLTLSMAEVCRKVQKQPINRPRPNEVGNDLEPFVIDAAKNNGLTASAPKAKSGKGKSTGYPDVVIKRQGKPTIYLEVKSYAAETHATTQRSFYLSPSDDPKVTTDGHHLLVGFEVKREGNLYWPVAFEIVDLYGLDCDMKAEFNSDNKRLYAASRCLVKQRVE